MFHIIKLKKQEKNGLIESVKEQKRKGINRDDLSSLYLIGRDRQYVRKLVVRGCEAA